MPDGRVIIRIGALPDSALKRALSGTVEAARKASRAVAIEQAKSSKDTEKAHLKASRASERETERAARAAIKAAEKVAAAQERAAEKAERARVLSAERAAKAEIREAEKTARSQVQAAIKSEKAQARAAGREAQRRRDIRVAVAGAAYGAVRGGVDLVQRGFGIAGMGSLEERLQTAGEFKEKLYRTGRQAGVSPEERAKIEQSLLDVSDRTNVSIMDMVDGLEQAHGRFNQFREFAADIGDIAKISKATGASIVNLVGAIGASSAAFQLDAEGRRDFTSALVAAAEAGAIDAVDFSQNFAGTAGTFQAATKRTGTAAAREFLATAQLVGTSQTGAAESATMVERFMSEIALPDTQARLRQIGVEALDDKGGLRDVGDIGRQLATNKAFKSAGIRQAVFPEIRAMQASQFITAQLSRDPEYYNRLKNVNAAEGNAKLNKNFAEMTAQPMYKLQNVGTRALTDTVRHADEIVEKITPAISELAKLQVRFPLLTESMSSLESAVRWAFGFVLANKMLGAAGGAGSALGGAAEMGEVLGATASKSLSKNSSWLTKSAGKAGQVLGGAFQVAATGFAAYELTSGVLRATGIDRSIESLGSKLYDLFHPREQMIEAPFKRGTSLVGDYNNTTAGKETAAARKEVEDKLGDFIAAAKPLTVPAGTTAANAPEATITLKVEGPGTVTRVDANGFGTIETIGDNGQRTLLPP